MKNCVGYYKGDPDMVKFTEKYKGNVTYLDKLKTTLISKFPRDQTDGRLWYYLSELVCPGSTGVTTPPTPMMYPSPSLSSLSSLASLSSLSSLHSTSSTPPSMFPSLASFPSTSSTYPSLLSSLASLPSTSSTPPSLFSSLASFPSTSSAYPSLMGFNIPKANSIFSAEIANALFNVGKFPTPASLMGLSSLFPPMPPHPSLLKYPFPSTSKSHTMTSSQL